MPEKLPARGKAQQASAEVGSHDAGVMSSAGVNLRVNAPFLRSEVCGRPVVDELPWRIDLLPGEAELVAQHLLDTLDTLFANSAVRASSKLCD